MSEEGGTKLRKRPPPQQQMQQQVMMEQQMPQQVPMPVQVQRPTAEELFKQAPPAQVPQQMQMPQAQVRENVVQIPKKKSMFGMPDSTNFKYATLVAVIFVVLNSKIVWRQLIKLPFMGSVEPSMIALIVNSLLAAVAYFVITNFIMK
jgi:hypothetical protein